MMSLTYHDEKCGAAGIIFIIFITGISGSEMVLCGGAPTIAHR